MTKMRSKVILCIIIWIVVVILMTRIVGIVLPILLWIISVCLMILRRWVFELVCLSSLIWMVIMAVMLNSLVNRPIVRIFVLIIPKIR